MDRNHVFGRLALGMTGGGNHLLSVAPMIVGVVLATICVVQHHDTVTVPAFLAETDGAAVQRCFGPYCEKMHSETAE